MLKTFQILLSVCAPDDLACWFAVVRVECPDIRHFPLPLPRPLALFPRVGTLSLPALVAAAAWRRCRALASLGSSCVSKAAQVLFTQ